MIAYLRGILIESSFSQVIIDVNGVGYEVNIPLSTFDKLPLEGGEAELFIHTAVREDAITLFGFATKQEKFPLKRQKFPIVMKPMQKRQSLPILLCTSPLSVAAHAQMESALALMGKLLFRS